MSDERKAAPFGSRITAFAYDYLLIAVYLVALALVSTAVMSFADAQTWAHFFSDPLRADLVAFLTTVLPVAVYFALTEGSSLQASWGKRKKGLRVESIDGKRLSFTSALLRALLKLLPWQIAHTCLFNIPGWPLNTGSPPPWVLAGLALMWAMVLGYALSILCRKSRQAVYDQVLGIRVVRVIERDG